LAKQLIKTAGRPILEHTLAVLDRHQDVDEVLIMMAPGHLDAVREIVNSGGYTTVRGSLRGAETRTGTSRRARYHLGDEEGKVLFHDAVRPLLSPRIVA